MGLEPTPTHASEEIKYVSQNTTASQPVTELDLNMEIGALPDNVYYDLWGLQFSMF